MLWTVEFLNGTVESELASLPDDIQARFFHIADRICISGLESLHEPHVKHLEGKLWEIRLTAGMVLGAYFM